MSAEKTKKVGEKASVKDEVKAPAKAAAKSAAKPKAKAAVKSEDKAEVKTEHKVEHKAEPKAEHKAEHKTEVKAEHKAETKAEHKAPVKKHTDNYIPRLKKLYDTEVVKGLQALYKYSTPMAIPRVVKVIINSGLGEATQDKTVIDSALEETTMIAAQKAVKTIARKSISNFHLREGMPIGVRATLRGAKMYDFMDKFISIALPRVRDFKGLNPSSFDGRGNFTVGLKEQLVFPEIDYDKIKKIRGMDITVVTTARSDDEAYQLLKQLGFPFRDK